MKNYTTSVRAYQKYLDYSLLVDPKVKAEIIKAGDAYLNDAKKDLDKKDGNYIEKKQKLDLLELLELVYQFKFEKSSDKISKLKENDILENNKNYYYFLKYITSKALASEDFTTIENQVKELDGFDYFIKKTDLILSKIQ